ncbi:MAG: protein-glutamate O-methyltransferase CheR [Polyangia bacterium]
MSGATRDELAFVRKLVRDQSGMVLNEDKEYLIVSKLNSLARKERIASLAELVRQLRDPSSTALRRAATEEMLIGETCFFRDGHPFEALRSTILPELARQRADERALNLWCAAAATGQEPYSLAIVLSEALPELSRWCVRLIATDLSEANLVRARAGLYSELEISRGMPEPMRARYFAREGESFRVHESLRRRVEFLRMNLVLGWPALPLLDLVLLRNVLIYFDAATRAAIIARVREHLRPGGYLLLGTSEALVDEAVGFTPVRVRSTVFYRRDP